MRAPAQVLSVTVAAALAAVAALSTVALHPAGSTVGATPSACTSEQLTPAVSSAHGGMGHVQEIVTLRNRSSAACRVEGYPKVQLLAASGRPLPTRVVHGQASTFPDTAVRPVELRPGDSASFDIGFDRIPGSTGAACPMAQQIVITPPAQTHALPLDGQLDPCGGVLHVSPVVAGAAGVT